MELISYPLASMLRRHSESDRLRHSELDIFLEYLLDGNALTEEAARLRTDMSGWRFGAVNYVLCAEAFEMSNGFRANLFDGMLQKNDKLVRYRNRLVAMKKKGPLRRTSLNIFQMTAKK
jgi:hypothetical protein